MLTTAQSEVFDEHGFTILPDVVTPATKIALTEAFGQSAARAGRRDGLRLQVVRELAESEPISGIARSILGPAARPVKATLFGKTATVNWFVAWHQDTTIPVRERAPAAGYNSWTIKNGVPHVRPPVGVLESMIAIRIDLDGSTEQSGPLRVLAGTHRGGILSAGAIDAKVRDSAPVDCLVPARGALIMRPLILHASPKLTSATARRILHIEFAANLLPAGVEWFEW